MNNEDWLPNDIDTLALWFEKFDTEAPAITTELGMEAKEVSAVTDLNANWLAAHKKVVALREKLAAAVLDQTAALKAANEPLRALARQVKASPKATPTLLATLGLLPAHGPDAGRVAAEKPALTLLQGPGRVEIKFAKYKHAGIRLYCRRGPETTFTEVGSFTSSPALDRRPNLLPGQAEHREYYAWYLDHDEPVGSQGDTASLAAAPTPG